MKTIIAFLHVIVMLLTFGAAAYADDDTITMEQAMRTAFHFVGLEEDDASFMKGHRGYDNGRPFFEISNHHFMWWFANSPVRAEYMCRLKAVLQAVLLLPLKAAYRSSPIRPSINGG